MPPSSTAVVISDHMQARFDQVSCLWAGRVMSQQARALESPVDIVVGTPQRVMQHAQDGNLFYGDVEVRQKQISLTVHTTVWV